MQKYCQALNAVIGAGDIGMSQANPGVSSSLADGWLLHHPAVAPSSVLIQASQVPGVSKLSFTQCLAAATHYLAALWTLVKLIQAQCQPLGPEPSHPHSQTHFPLQEQDSSIRKE
jgi:hypothetical protein